MVKIKTQEIQELMISNGLRYSSIVLPEFIEKAEKEKLAYSKFLENILRNEQKEKKEKKRQRNYSAAHFPPEVHEIADYDISELDSGITQTQLDQLKEMIWLESSTNILLLGPPGLGKTMLLDRLLYNAKCYSLEGDSYRLKHPIADSQILISGRKKTSQKK